MLQFLYLLRHFLTVTTVNNTKGKVGRPVQKNGCGLLETSASGDGRDIVALLRSHQQCSIPPKVPNLIYDLFFCRALHVLFVLARLISPYLELHESVLWGDTKSTSAVMMSNISSKLMSCKLCA